MVVTRHFSLIYYYFKTKLTRFEIYKSKIIKFSGIFYKLREEIEVASVDYYETKQDFFNKLIGNFKIEIYTSGKSETDLVVGDIQDTTRIIELLKIIKK